MKTFLSHPLLFDVERSYGIALGGEMRVELVRLGEPEPPIPTDGEAAMAAALYWDLNVKTAS